MLFPCPTPRAGEPNKSAEVGSCPSIEWQTEHWQPEPATFGPEYEFDYRPLVPCAEAKRPRAMLLLSCAYWKGENGKNDKAVRLLREAAELGEPDAAFIYARNAAYPDPADPERDIRVRTTVVPLMERAAKLGSLDAQTWLGYYYMQEKRDDKAAERWYVIPHSSD
jgi:TPR repeat protein